MLTCVTVIHQAVTLLATASTAALCQRSVHVHIKCEIVLVLLAAKLTNTAAGGFAFASRTTHYECRELH